MNVQGELGPDPLVPSLPARAVQEHVLSVLRHVFDQVVGKTQVGRGQAQHLPQLRVLDLDTTLLYLKDHNHIHTLIFFFLIFLNAASS